MSNLTQVEAHKKVDYLVSNIFNYLNNVSQSIKLMKSINAEDHSILEVSSSLNMIVIY